MSSKSKINIISGLSQEFSGNFNVGDVTYHVQTEDTGTKNCKIISRVYQKGELVLTRKSDYSHIVNLKDFEEKLKALMGSCHKATIDFFIKDMSQKQKTKSDYFEEVKKLLRRGRGKTALRTLRESLEKFPSDPFLMSYYGCLVAVVENNPKEGIRLCREAIVGVRDSLPFGSEFFYPALYLNLGRACLKGNYKTEAIDAFQEGLKNDPENHDLLWELRKLGMRKRPPIPFLQRSNPVNKYIGLIVSKVAR
jgi:tetratricopeptide (TPR) repeat protein